MEFLKAILFGIVEGITEWLPISSTGHLILLNEFIKLDVSERFWSVFLVVIQLGAICAAIYVYWERIIPFYRIYPTDEEFEEYGEYAKLRTGVDTEALYLWIKIIIACIPAAIVGVLFDDKIDELFYHPIPVALALIIVGALMAQSLKEIEWDKFEIALPAFLTVIAMPLTYNISYGFAFAFLIYPITMIAAGRKKELNPVVIALFFVFVVMLYVLNVLPSK